ncbi:pentatricopeptide repeat-containing protein At3g29230-like [Papaver somniferum]|uniref:pentatricopeptide repeat-containing protein At3g29230-like n=1 Tax=Papaver somniferum TaxID=3469 RepID=UPI000E702772|nr:pentatricopeptide repeat-containing protein At3g29230-like [Papaver somniferum]
MLHKSEHEADVICWNAMIDGYLKCEDLDSAIGLFESMPDKNNGSWNVMISRYAKAGEIEIAQEFFNKMPERDDVSWSAIIYGYIKGDYFKEALRVFHEMQMNGVRPRRYVLSSVLAACANVGALDQVLSIRSSLFYKESGRDN